MNEKEAAEGGLFFLLFLCSYRLGCVTQLLFVYTIRYIR
jgi:hypothetical protein